MRSMFAGALSFNKALLRMGNQLNVNVNLANMLDNRGMDLVNYDATLVGFNAGSVTGRNLEQRVANTVLLNQMGQI